MTVDLARPSTPVPFIGVHEDAIGETEPLGIALRRLCVTCLDRAVMGLTDDHAPDVGVHEARKALKRMRAAIRLVRDEVGFWRYRQENVVVRDTARVVAPVRDGAVLLETLDGLATRYHGVVVPGVWEELRSVLADRHAWASQRVIRDSETRLKLLTTLKTALRRFEAWPVEAEIPDAWGTIAPGLLRVYRRGFVAMDAAAQSRTEEAFHGWRKRVKYLRHQLEFLETLWPSLMRATTAELDDLGEILGEEHDLAVLESVIGGEPGLLPRPTSRHVLVALIRHERRILQDAALWSGRRVYAEQPQAFVGRLGAYWAAWRPAN